MSGTQRSICLCCFLVFIFAAAVGVVHEGQAQAWLSPDVLLKEGLNAFYNDEYDEANGYFDAYIAASPEDPVGYWRKAYNWYFRLRFEQKTDYPKLDALTLKSFFSLVSRGTEIADAKIAANQDANFYLYVKACLLAMRGGLETKNVSKLAALSTLKEVIAVASQSDYQDAKYLIGLANYRGSSYSFLPILLGLPHNKEKGLECVFESVAMNDGKFVDDIWFLIFRIETDKKNTGRFGEDNIRKLFAYLRGKYPRNEALQKYLREKQ